MVRYQLVVAEYRQSFAEAVFASRAQQRGLIGAQGAIVVIERGGYVVDSVSGGGVLSDWASTR